MAAADLITRIPLNTLAIPLGLAGLADIWSDSTAALALPAVVGQMFWIIAAIGWLGMITAHLVRGHRSTATLGSQLRHPVQGPLASLVPLVGMLLADDLHAYLPIAGVVLGVASISVSTLFAGWLVSTWTTGELHWESLHGGYFLPTVAAGYIASYTAATLGSRSIAIGAFVVASFFWVALFTLLIARLAFRPSLPAPLLPTLAILMAPPAVAARAWFAIAGNNPNEVQDALAALAVVLVIVEGGILRRYLRLSFSLGFWSFTFPVAAMADLAVAWLNLERPAGWQIVVVALVVGVTALVAAIGVRSVGLWLGGRTLSAEAQLTRADDLIAPRAQEAASR